MNTKVIDKIKSLKELEHKADSLQKQQNDCIIISLCFGPACQASANTDLYTGFKKEIDKYRDSFDKKIIIRRNGCHGYCEKGPIVVIYPREICYLSVKKEDIPEIVAAVINKFRRKIFSADDSSSFILELPTYRVPKFSSVLVNTYHSTKSYILRAGPVILIFSLVLWFFSYFPDFNPELETGCLSA